jgi:hypothetical protein
MANVSSEASNPSTKQEMANVSSETSNPEKLHVRIIRRSLPESTRKLGKLLSQPHICCMILQLHFDNLQVEHLNKNNLNANDLAIKEISRLTEKNK